MVQLKLCSVLWSLPWSFVPRVFMKPDILDVLFSFRFGHMEREMIWSVQLHYCSRALLWLLRPLCSLMIRSQALEFMSQSFGPLSHYCSRVPTKVDQVIADQGQGFSPLHNHFRTHRLFLERPQSRTLRKDVDVPCRFISIWCWSAAFNSQEFTHISRLTRSFLCQWPVREFLWAPMIPTMLAFVASWTELH